MGELLKQLSEVLQVGGGYGIAAAALWAYWMERKKNDVLQKEMRDSLVSSTKELVEVLTENNIVAKRQADAFERYVARGGSA